MRKRDLFEHVLDLLIACAEFSLRGRAADVRIDRNNMWISDGSNEPCMNGKTGEDARSGNMGTSTHHTIQAPIHMSASVMDADGVDKVFTNHADRIQRHFENTLRKMNR
jgi:hypothetical protein